MMQERMYASSVFCESTFPIWPLNQLVCSEAHPPPQWRNIDGPIYDSYELFKLYLGILTPIGIVALAIILTWHFIHYTYIKRTLASEIRSRKHSLSQVSKQYTNAIQTIESLPKYEEMILALQKEISTLEEKRDSIIKEQQAEKHRIEMDKSIRRKELEELRISDDVVNDITI